MGAVPGVVIRSGGAMEGEPGTRPAFSRRPAELENRVQKRVDKTSPPKRLI